MISSVFKDKQFKTSVCLKIDKRVTLCLYLQNLLFESDYGLKKG